MRWPVISPLELTWATGRRAGKGWTQAGRRASAARRAGPVAPHLPRPPVRAAGGGRPRPGRWRMGRIRTAEGRRPDAMRPRTSVARVPRPWPSNAHTWQVRSAGRAGASRHDKFNMDIIIHEDEIKPAKCYVMMTNPIAFLIMTKSNTNQLNMMKC